MRKRFSLRVERKRPNVRRETNAVFGMRVTIMHKKPTPKAATRHEVEVCRGNEVSKVKVTMHCAILRQPCRYYLEFARDRLVNISKMTRAPCRKRTGEALPRAEHVGDLIAADHKVLGEGCESGNDHRYAVVVQDLATQWLQSYPCNHKNFLRDPEEPAEVPGSDEETKSHLQ